MSEDGAVEVVIEDDGTIRKVAVYHRTPDGAKAWTHTWSSRKECERCQKGSQR